MQPERISRDQWRNDAQPSNSEAPLLELVSSSYETQRQVETRIRGVCSKNDPAREGFIKVYQEAFAAAPYFEQFTLEFVADHVWNPHLEHSIIVAEQNGLVVGLGCAHPMLAPGLSPSSQEFLLKQTALPFDLRSAIYMSELAVSETARGQGLGTRLVLERCDWGLRNGFTHYVMRTAAEGSHSYNLYKRLGAVEIPGTQKVDEVDGGGIETASKQRIYLWGRLSDCANAIAQMRAGL